jgi:hypothetical protein
MGATILVLSADWRDRMIAPGPLAQQHSQLLERTGAAANCAACHSAAERSVAGWAVSLVSANNSAQSQSQLCMKCHEKTIAGELAVAAHNVPADALAQLTAAKNTTSDVGGTLPLPLPKRQGNSIACSSCHREHHGAAADLTAMNNSACQTCHQRKFESFAADHPDFGVWPYERRTRIAFNHASHRGKHFAEKKQSFDCRACHVEDATGTFQLTASYEATCAKCHDEKIATSIGRGVPMFAMPTLDIAALKSAGFDVGSWPKGATGDFDGRLPPLMKLLLAGDSAAAKAMQRLGADFDFQDVNPKDREQLEACATLEAAIKRLVAAMAESPDAAVRERMQQALGVTLPKEQVDALVAGLSTDALRTASDAWGFGPGAAGKDSKEKEEYKTPITGPRYAGTSPGGRVGMSRPIAFAPAGTWFRDDSTFAVRYRPRGHADPAFTALLNVIAATPDVSQRPVAAAMLKELTKPSEPGLCVSCHSLEKSAAGELMVNWRSYDRSKEPRGFTKFSHSPHLLLPQLADCTHCHAIDDAAANAAAYTDVDPRRFASDFVAISKRQCVECHTAKAAGDRCQSCHNYHVQSADRLRIADFGLRIGETSAQSAIRNPQPEVPKTSTDTPPSHR